MSKHQEILSYLEELPVGKRVSVRSISNHLGSVMERPIGPLKKLKIVDLWRPVLEVVLSVLNPRKLLLKD